MVPLSLRVKFNNHPSLVTAIKIIGGHAARCAALRPLEARARIDDN